MVYRRDPVEARQRPALRIGNGNKRGIPEATGHERKMRQIEPPVHCRDEGNLASKQQWDMDPVGMAVDHVEGFCLVPDSMKESRVSGPGVGQRPTEPQGTWTGRDEVGARAGIATGKQSDITAQTHQFFGKPGDHPLGAAIEFRGYALRQRCYFRDSHSLQL